MALDVRASRVTWESYRAGVVAIAEGVSDSERSVGVMVPWLFHPDGHKAVASAVKESSLGNRSAHRRDAVHERRTTDGGYGE